MIAALLLALALYTGNDTAAQTQRFYDGVMTGCAGATIVLLAQQGIEVTPDEVAAFCANVEQLARDHEMHLR